VKRKTIHVSELSKIKMVAGNEFKYPKVINNGKLMEWVAFGWIDITEDEPIKDNYPEVIYKK